MITDHIMASIADLVQEVSQYFVSLQWERLGAMLSYNPSEPLLFSSGLFLFLFLALTLVYMALRKALTPRILFLTLFSYYFFYKSSGMYFLLLVLVTVTDFYIAKGVSRLKEKADEQAERERRALGEEEATPHYGRAKGLLALSLAIDLGLLCYFKYTNFFAGMVTQMIGGNFQPWDIFLPVGISFYTFKTISYVVDVYRGKMKPMESLLDYAFYVSFFPTLLAGPIVRAIDFAPQIRRPLQISNQLFGMGVYFVLIGLAKKCIISDYIAQNFVDRIFDNPTLFSGGEVLLGLYGYTVQIYCDFSGYSDMAIGISALLGFTIPMNFNAPWKSDSVTDFWRRWHISLSSWIRDYVYIPLGGNRRGELRTYLNHLATMLIAGVWHGATGMFVVWGLLHGVGLVVNKFFHRHVFVQIPPSPFAKPLAWLTTFGYVAFAWIFFRAPSPTTALQLLHQISSDCSLTEFLPFLAARPLWTVLTLVALELHSVRERDYLWLRDRFVALPWLLKLLVALVVVQAAINLSGASVQPFIYSRF